MRGRRLFCGSRFARSRRRSRSRFLAFSAGHWLRCRGTGILRGTLATLLPLRILGRTRIAMPAMLIALIPLVAVPTLIALVSRWAILVTLVALSTTTLLLLGRTLTLNLLWRTLEAPQLLPKGLNI